MKTLIFLPLLGYLFNTTAIDTGFKILKNDTIYEYTTSKPHECYFMDCPTKGQLVFYSSSKSETERYLQKMHFQYPALTKQMCISILKGIEKYTNL
jgi:hypothetical protein